MIGVFNCVEFIGNHSIFDETVDGKASPNAHAFFPIDEQRVDLFLQIALEIRFDFEQLLMLCFGLLQLAMQHRYRILNVTDLLDEVDESQIPENDQIV